METGNQDTAPLAISVDPLQHYARLARLQAYILANFSHPFSLAEAARIAALEKKYFSRYFKACVGRNFSAWLTERRIARAMELLHERDDPILILAFEVGIQGLRTFERRFKRVAGVTPRAFRLRLREAARGNGSRQTPEFRR